MEAFRSPVGSPFHHLTHWTSVTKCYQALTKWDDPQSSIDIPNCWNIHAIKSPLHAIKSPFLFG